MVRTPFLIYGKKLNVLEYILRDGASLKIYCPPLDNRQKTASDRFVSKRKSSHSKVVSQLVSSKNCSISHCDLEVIRLKKNLPSLDILYPWWLFHDIIKKCHLRVQEKDVWTLMLLNCILCINKCKQKQWLLSLSSAGQRFFSN